MKRILKEPLLHFFVLGLALFVTYSRVSKPTNEHEPGKILVTQGQIEHLATGFAKTHQRPPSADELAGLVRDFVREEVYCREAMALGLDREDTIIRRRLRQKMEFVSDDIAAQSEPGDADLDAYLQAHSDKFRVEPQFSFRQVYLNPEKHGGNLARNAAQLLAQLNQAGATADITAIGDTSLLERDFDAARAGGITRQFGEAFAAKLGGLQPGQWQGPIESAFGMHLVFVSQRKEGRLPALADVRDAVRREWEGTRRLEANERFYQELLKRYAVTIEEPMPPTESSEVVKAP